MKQNWKNYRISLRIDDETKTYIDSIKDKYNISMSDLLVYSVLSDSLKIIQEEQEEDISKGCSILCNNLNQINKSMRMIKLIFSKNELVNLSAINGNYKKIEKLLIDNFGDFTDLGIKLQQVKRKIQISNKQGLFKEDVIRILQEYFSKDYLVTLQEDELQIKKRKRGN